MSIFISTCLAILLSLTVLGGLRFSGIREFNSFPLAFSFIIATGGFSLLFSGFFFSGEFVSFVFWAGILFLFFGFFGFLFAFSR